MSLTHVLLTRFNLPSPGTESLVRARSGWLADRQRLFERFCLPSVRAQSNQNFQWIIYFDPRSPAWLRRRVDELSSCGLFTPKFRESVSAEDLRADIRAIVGGTSDRLLTTNLDNDDSLSVDFVDRVQRVDPGHARSAIYLERGLIRHGVRLYLRRDPSNAFCSVAESGQEPVTCWMDWHNMLERHMPVVRISGQPGWIQVVHAGNVSNRVRGRLVSPLRYESVFGDLLAGVAVPTKAALLSEALWQVPRRAGSELARGTVKSAVLLLGGRAGLDKINELRARARVAG